MQITTRHQDRVEQRGSTFGFTKAGDRLLETADVFCQRLGHTAVGLNREHSSFVAGPHHFAEETDRSMSFKLARKVQTATVIKQHGELNACLRSADVT